MKFYVYVTYTDRFVVEAASRAEVRRLVQENWRKFGAQYDHLRIAPAPEDAVADKLEDGLDVSVAEPRGEHAENRK